jgi:hypothetical protein
MEYKYRGKKVDTGEWLQGSLINNVFKKSDTGKYCCYIIPDDDGFEYCGADCWTEIAEFFDDFEVIPETVGMWTQEKDMENTEIYLGDRLKDGYGVIYEVEWNRDYSGFVLKLNDNFASFHHENMLVISSIHDNPGE